ncbi:hypothetical protein ACLOJK_031743 [Asimina triloba]
MYAGVKIVHGQQDRWCLIKEPFDETRGNGACTKTHENEPLRIHSGPHLKDKSFLAIQAVHFAGPGDCLSNVSSLATAPNVVFYSDEIPLGESGPIGSCHAHIDLSHFFPADFIYCSLDMRRANITLRSPNAPKSRFLLVDEMKFKPMDRRIDSHYAKVEKTSLYGIIFEKRFQQVWTLETWKCKFCYAMAYNDARGVGPLKNPMTAQLDMRKLKCPPNRSLWQLAFLLPFHAGDVTSSGYMG